MKKFFSSFFAGIFVLAVLAGAVSCSGLSEKNGSVSFSFSGRALDQLKNSSARALYADGDTQTNIAQQAAGVVTVEGTAYTLYLTAYTDGSYEITLPQVGLVSKGTYRKVNKSLYVTEASYLPLPVTGTEMVTVDNPTEQGPIDVSGTTFTVNSNGNAIYFTSIEGSGSDDGDDDEKGNRYEFTISANGGYSETRTIAVTEKYKTYTVTFNEIPVGTSVYFTADVYEYYTVDGSEKRNHLFTGKSDTITIASGYNTAVLDMEDVSEEHKITYTFEFYFEDPTVASDYTLMDSYTIGPKTVSGRDAYYDELEPYTEGEKTFDGYTYKYFDSNSDQDDDGNLVQTVHLYYTKNVDWQTVGYIKNTQTEVVTLKTYIGGYYIIDSSSGGPRSKGTYNADDFSFTELFVKDNDSEPDKLTTLSSPFTVPITGNEETFEFKSSTSQEFVFAMPNIYESYAYIVNVYCQKADKTGYELKTSETYDEFDTSLIKTLATELAYNGYVLNEEKTDEDPVIDEKNRTITMNMYMDMAEVDPMENVFFPVGYENKNVAAWYVNTQTSGKETVAATVTAFYLFDDYSFVVGEYAVKSEGTGVSTTKKIKGAGTYKLSTTGDYSNNSGTFVESSGTEYSFMILSGNMTVVADDGYILATRMPISSLPVPSEPSETSSAKAVYTVSGTADEYTGDAFVFTAYDDLTYVIQYIPATATTETFITFSKGTYKINEDTRTIWESEYYNFKTAEMVEVTAPKATSIDVSSGSFDFTSGYGVTVHFGVQSVTAIPAFFPTGYKADNVVAWYSCAENDVSASKYKTLAIFLFNDGTFISTKHKISADGTIERVIEQSGSYTLKTAGEYKNNTGTATIGTETTTYTIENGTFTLTGGEDSFTLQSNSDIPDTTDPTTEPITEKTYTFAVRYMYDTIGTGISKQTEAEEITVTYTGDSYVSAQTEWVMKKLAEIKETLSEYYDADNISWTTPTAGDYQVEFWVRLKTVTYTFDLDGGETTTTSTSTVSFKQNEDGTYSMSGKYSVPIAFAEPTKDNYIFAGWKNVTDADATLPETFGLTDATFVAQWNNVATSAITVTLGKFADDTVSETIKLTQEDVTDDEGNVTGVRITATEGFASYVWIVDGEEITGTTGSAVSTSNVCEILVENYSAGTHDLTLTVTVEDDANSPYSVTSTFTITK